MVKRMTRKKRQELPTFIKLDVESAKDHKQGIPAILVPYRDNPAKERSPQLKAFVEHFSKGPWKEFSVYIIEQSEDDRAFNRGALLNIGARLSKKHSHMILHDVDLLPGDSIASYYVKNPEIPIHIARCWDRYKGQEYLGGIISISEKNFTDLNGYPNNYWGWGGEDDELRRRVNDIKLQIENPKEEDCEITDLEEMDLQEKLQVLKENQDWKNMKKRELKDQHSNTWQSNGINSIEGKYNDVKSENINVYTTKITIVARKSCN
jgi:hypothetical protein